MFPTGFVAPLSPEVERLLAVLPDLPLPPDAGPCAWSLPLRRGEPDSPRIDVEWNFATQYEVADALVLLVAAGLRCGVRWRFKFFDGAIPRDWVIDVPRDHVVTCLGRATLGPVGGKTLRGVAYAVASERALRQLVALRAKLLPLPEDADEVMAAALADCLLEVAS